MDALILLPGLFKSWATLGALGGFFGGTVQSWAWNAWNACREMLREAGETGGLFQGLL